MGDGSREWVDVDAVDPRVRPRDPGRYATVPLDEGGLVIYDPEQRHAWVRSDLVVEVGP